MLIQALKSNQIECELSTVLKHIFRRSVLNVQTGSVVMSLDRNIMTHLHFSLIECEQSPCALEATDGRAKQAEVY